MVCFPAGSLHDVCSCPGPGSGGALGVGFSEVVAGDVLSTAKCHLLSLPGAVALGSSVSIKIASLGYKVNMSELPGAGLPEQL